MFGSQLATASCCRRARQRDAWRASDLCFQLAPGSPTVPEPFARSRATGHSAINPGAGRRGPGERLRLLPAQIDQFARTVRHTPEVMVKISGGGSSAKAVAAHFNYLSRQEFEIETDDGEYLKGKEAQRDRLDDWELDLDAAEARFPYRGVPGRKPAKVVHNIVLSLPAGTPAAGVLAASRAFAREQFALKHRYALVLHLCGVVVYVERVPQPGFGGDQQGSHST